MRIFHRKIIRHCKRDIKFINFFFFFRSLVLRSCLLSNKITSRYVKLNIVLRRFISRIKRNIAYCLKRWRWHWSHRKFSTCFLHAIFNFCIKRIFFRIFPRIMKTWNKTILLHILYKMFHTFLLNNRKLKKISEILQLKMLPSIESEELNH